MPDLLVMVPTRGRKAQCERLLKSFNEMTDDADLVFVTDGDDHSYDDMDWGDAGRWVIDPRESLSGKLNKTAEIHAHDYDALMFVGDDHVFGTPGWDSIMMKTLADMGGTGMVYPDDKRRTDVPEIILISSDIVRALGHFAEPTLKHYYLDNSWGELGKRAGLIRFCREAVVEHLHYSVCDETERDQTYVEAENAWGGQDYTAFRDWQANLMQLQVAFLRRKFNRDAQWILGV
jgi:hypothetical protein